MNYLQAHRVRCLLPVPLMTSAELRRGLGNDKCPTQPAGKWDGMGHLTYILWISYAISRIIITLPHEVAHVWRFTILRQTHISSLPLVRSPMSGSAPPLLGLLVESLRAPAVWKVRYTVYPRDNDDIPRVDLRRNYAVVRIFRQTQVFADQLNICM